MVNVTQQEGMNTNQEINEGEKAEEELLAVTMNKRTAALEHLESLVIGLQQVIQTKSRVHLEIKTKSTSLGNALKLFKNLNEEWQEIQQCHRHAALQAASGSSHVPTTADAGVTEETDTGVEGDSESATGEATESHGKRKSRSSPKSTDKQAKKQKDKGNTPPVKEAVESPANKADKPPAWEPALSRQAKRKQNREQRKEQLPKQPPKGTRPEPKRKKPRQWIRPDALIIQPAEKEKYAEILRRIKQDVPEDQVRNTVEKIDKTTTGDMRITLSRKNTDKGQALQKAIMDILQADAKVICKGPQEVLEIRDLDDVTTQEDIQAALKKEAGEDCEIPTEAIKIRKAYRGTQTAKVTLSAVVAQKLLGGNGKIRIGWVNCRIRAIERPTQCFKCWNFGHLGSQCESKLDRSKLCIRCGQEGHKVADCKKPAKCVLCAEKLSAENAAHHAGSYRCPVFKAALQKLTNKRT